MLLDKIKFDPKAPFVARYAGSSLVGSLNFMISNLIQQQLRRDLYGAPTEGGIDAANEEAAGHEATAEETRTREEQGFATVEEPLVTAAKLKLVRDSVQDDLLRHAARKPMVTDPSKTIPDQFHIGIAFADSVDYQGKMGARINDAQVRAEAKVVGCTEDEIRTVLLSRHNRQLNFLKDNKQRILDIYHGLAAKGTDGHPYDLEDADAVFANLPAIVQLRLAAAVDKGLYKGRMREVERHMNRQVDALANLALIDGVRREALQEVGRWYLKAEFKQSLDEALSRGGNLPQFAPAPQPPAADEKTEALKRHAA
jgi:hypothetical protein